MKAWRTLAVGSAAAALALAGWAVLVEPGRVSVRTVDLALPSWPPALDGLRVAVMGDIHAGAPHVGVDKLRTLVADVNRASPDVVVLLGDYVIHGVVAGRFVEPEITAEVLGGLRAPGGVVAVLGNHDWWYDGARVRRALEARGIVVLENEAHQVASAGGALWLAGLPPFPPPIVPSRYGSRFAAGHVIEGGRHLFVTTGVGTSILPVRFGVPPEVVILALHPGRSQ